MRKRNWIIISIIIIVFLMLFSCIHPFPPEGEESGDLTADTTIIVPDVTNDVTPTPTPEENPCILGMWQRIGSTGSVATYNFRRWKNGYYKRVNSSHDKYVTGSWSMINESQVRLHEDGLYSMVFDLTCDGESIWLRNTTAGSDNTPYQFFKL